MANTAPKVSTKNIWQQITSSFWMPVGLVNRVRNTGDFVVPGFVIMQFTVTLAGGLNDISY